MQPIIITILCDLFLFVCLVTFEFPLNSGMFSLNLGISFLGKNEYPHPGQNDDLSGHDLPHLGQNITNPPILLF